MAGGNQSQALAIWTSMSSGQRQATVTLHRGRGMRSTLQEIQLWSVQWCTSLHCLVRFDQTESSSMNIVDANWENDALDCTSSLSGQLYWRDQVCFRSFLICPANLRRLFDIHILQEKC